LNAHDIELLDAASGAAATAAAPPPLETTGERRQTDALLEALLADPTSDDPRRVIADALLAKTDPRGEFITLELALAGPLGIRRREELAKRHAELLAKHGKTWFATRLEHRRDRGFIASIKGTVKQLVAEAGLFDSQPIVEVHATNVDAKSLKQLLDAPWLARVHHLAIKGELGDAGWKALVSSSQTQQLEHLNVLGCKISMKGIGALAGNLPRVRTLVLTANPIGDAGIAALRGWQPLADLQALYASGCSLTVKGVADLLAGALPHLEKLTLSQNKLGDPIGPALLAAAKRVPRLAKLELRKIGATAALLESLGAPKYCVDVRDNRIGVKDVAGNARFRAA
jgi:uncharacterized protein (TIGR02996 family)